MKTGVVGGEGVKVGKGVRGRKGVSIRRFLIGWKCGTDWVTLMKKKLRWFGFVCFVYC